MPVSPISFARGAPSLDIVDVDGLRAAADRAFAEDPARMCSYGTAVGYPPLREWIADRHGVAPARVIVTNGSLQADALLFDELVGDGDSVVVERPTYDRTLLGLRQRGARVQAVDLEADGVDVEALADALAQGLRPVLAHLITNFHNPGGCTLSLAKRERLLELAGAHRMLLFEDDPYVSLRFEGEGLPSMLALDAGQGRVVYASSFSKTVCPGIRVGYLVGPEELIDRIRVRATNTYISPNMVAQAIVNQFCRSGAIDVSVQHVREALRERARTLVAALERELPDVTFTPPDGGYFLWLRLPDDLDSSALSGVAAEQGVAVVKGADFMEEGGERYLRLAYSGVTPAQIEEGVGRLAEAARTLRRSAARA